MLLDLNAYSWPVFKKEINKLAVLALPMLVAQVAQVGIGFVDTVMAGGAGKDDLAAVALGSSVFATIYITFMGVMTALNPMIAQLFGAGKADEVGETGRQGIWFGVMLGIIGMLLMWLLVWPFQAWLSLSDKVENMMALYMFFTGLAMPAAMVVSTWRVCQATSAMKAKPIVSDMTALSRFKPGRMLCVAMSMMMLAPRACASARPRNRRWFKAMRSSSSGATSTTRSSPALSR